VVGEKIYLFGGANNEDGPMKDLHSLKINKVEDEKEEVKF
jgi:hypothetical protein